jgi:hypothetical protein
MWMPGAVAFWPPSKSGTQHAVPSILFTNKSQRTAEKRMLARYLFEKISQFHFQTGIDRRSYCRRSVDECITDRGRDDTCSRNKLPQKFAKKL